jgi:hypothetical protein
MKWKLSIADSNAVPYIPLKQWRTSLPLLACSDFCYSIYIHYLIFNNIFFRLICFILIGILMVSYLSIIPNQIPGITRRYQTQDTGNRQWSLLQNVTLILQQGSSWMRGKYLCTLFCVHIRITTTPYRYPLLSPMQYSFIRKSVYDAINKQTKTYRKCGKLDSKQFQTRAWNISTEVRLRTVNLR